jgi:outer membrane protein assembly factor BamA
MLARKLKVLSSKLLCGFLIFLCLFMFSFQPTLECSYQEDIENKEKEKKETDESDFHAKLKGEKTWETIINIPGRILFIPFWLLDQTLKPFLSLVGVAPQVTSKLARMLVSADGKRGLLPSTSDRTGLGIKFFQKDLVHPGSSLDLTARVGMEWRQLYRLRLRDFHLGGPLVTDFYAHYLYLPTERFFGIGNDSRQANESNFAHRQIMASAFFGSRLSQSTKLGFVFGLARNSISEGQDSDDISTTDLPPDARKEIPGLDEKINFYLLQFSLQHDSRNRLGNPSAGWKINLKGGFFREIKQAEYGFWKASADFQRYQHLFYDRVLVLRIAADITESKGGLEIPFYYLSELGRRETIRGFRRGRFRDEDMIMGSLEYRYPVMARDNFQLGVDAFLFLDAGQVAPDIFSQFSMKEFHVGFGGGLRIFSKNGRILHVFVGKSSDGFRFYIGMYD